MALAASLSETTGSLTITSPQAHSIHFSPVTSLLEHNILVDTRSYRMLCLIGLPGAGGSGVVSILFAYRSEIQRNNRDMVKIRLMRMGMKATPSYRVVVADSASPRDGRFIENIGWYNPLTEPSTINIDADRVRHWLSVGAQPTDSVRQLLVRAGILERAEQPEATAK